MIGFRNTDPRWPFLRSDATQAPGRWHGHGEGPTNYFADTPAGAWAEFLRHEEITEAADLAGVRRSLWAVELPEADYVRPTLPTRVLRGDPSHYERCRAEARRLRASGHTRLRTPSAALQAGVASGWSCTPHETPITAPRNGVVFVLFGAPEDLVGWPASEAGQPPARVLPLVRHFTA